MKRVLYFGYFIKNTNYNQLINSFKEVKSVEGIMYKNIFYDMVLSSFKYKASFHDYFMFEFYNKKHEEKDSFLTTGILYEFYNNLNDKNKAKNFKNKVKFNKIFEDFMRREFIFLGDCNEVDFVKWLDDKDYIIAKPQEGQAGRGVEKISVKEYKDSNELYSYLKKGNIELIEELICQHDEMNKINSSCVNTIRVVTVRSQGYSHIISAVLRIGLRDHIDNFSAGGMAAPIDIMTGTVYKAAVSKKESQEYEHHPESNYKIKGFEVPYWHEVIKMVKEASEVISDVNTIGWDVAITEFGPELIEGNDNWDKDLFQLPYREGRKYLLEKYL